MQAYTKTALRLSQTVARASRANPQNRGSSAAEEAELLGNTPAPAGPERVNPGEQNERPEEHGDEGGSMD